MGENVSWIATLRPELVEGSSRQLWAVPSVSQLMWELHWRAAAVGRWLLCHSESTNPINMVIIQKVIYMIGNSFFPPLHLVMRTANTIYETLCTINTSWESQQCWNNNTWKWRNRGTCSHQHLDCWLCLVPHCKVGGGKRGILMWSSCSFWADVGVNSWNY